MSGDGWNGTFSGWAELGTNWINMAINEEDLAEEDSFEAEAGPRS